MPRFISQRDLDFFNQISKEFVETAVENPVVLYKISVHDSKSNFYGESLNKTFLPGVQLHALIEHEQQTSEYEGVGPDTSQTANFRFQRERLRELDTYPQAGDIIDWNNTYFEVSNVIENQLPGGRVNQNFSFVCETFMVRRSSINIEERNK